MPLTNVRFYAPSRFFRDERAATLEELALEPVFDGAEMGLLPDVLAPKLRLARYYAPLFAAAFGDTAITNDRAARALAMFVRSLKTTDSKLDSMLALAVQITPSEQRGLLMFEGLGCKSCHESYAVASHSARNNGLNSSSGDAGARHGRFKAPSLRNAVLRPPYMHDGRFNALEEVIEFYDHGVQANPDLDRQLRDRSGAPKLLHLTDTDKTDLMAFLRMMTDRRFLSDPRFASPFVRQ